MHGAESFNTVGPFDLVFCSGGCQTGPEQTTGSILLSLFQVHQFFPPIIEVCVFLAVLFILLICGFSLLLLLFGP